MADTPRAPEDLAREQHTIDKHRHFPHLEEFFAYMPAAREESARGEVLISASYLDELLRRVLLAFFVEGKKNAELVEDTTGPLGTFSARIRLCAALGLLKEREVSELNTIRRIRNYFSHQIHVSFDDQKIKDLCGNLLFKVPGDHPSRHQFSSATHGLILNLINRAAYVSRHRCVQKVWPY